MRVLTFSTHFPKGHPKEGQPTYFIEKILRGLYCLDDHIKPLMDFEVWKKIANGLAPIAGVSMTGILTQQ